MKITKEFLQDPPKKYRPLPFWSWNAKLETAETLEQVEKMDENGIGGYFMHARGGLKTEYMSDEWFDEYMYQIVVNKKYLPDSYIAEYDSEPIMLEPWDPMGSLAL